jgi:hypothetical protein
MIAKDAGETREEKTVSADHDAVMAGGSRVDSAFREGVF